MVEYMGVWRREMISAQERHTQARFTHWYGAAKDAVVQAKGVLWWKNHTGGHKNVSYHH
ncbi:MAG: hypothetical protein IJC98_07650 [Clostridia bacterium]|nr:hypothetical protein [Clostridia bacterium]